jgi:hypothetical protein
VPLAEGDFYHVMRKGDSFILKETKDTAEEAFYWSVPMTDALDCLEETDRTEEGLTRSLTFKAVKDNCPDKLERHHGQDDQKKV